VRIATSIVTWRLPIIVGVAALAIGCRQEAPLAPAMAAKVADIAEVNTDSGFVDSIGRRGKGALRWRPPGTGTACASSTWRGRRRGSSRLDRRPTTPSIVGGAAGLGRRRRAA